MGSQPSVIANKLIRSSASQNSGTENPIKVITVVDLSKNEPRRTAEKALVAVVQEAYIQGVSTRSVDELVNHASSGYMRILLSPIYGI